MTEKLDGLCTPQIADACLQLGIAFRIAPVGIKPVFSNGLLHGKALPVRHYGSVDVFLEVCGRAKEGDVLVIDNNGRLDEGCIGDLTALEVQAHQIRGIVLWGAHRDTKELEEIKLPVFSYAAFPSGPRRLDAREKEALISAKFGEFLVTRDDYVFADEDGVVFVEEKDVQDIIRIAQDIRSKERNQAEKIKNGETLYKQLKFRDYLSRHASDNSYTFRKHLLEIGGAIER